jgi:hypothetical protein
MRYIDKIFFTVKPKLYNYHETKKKKVTKPHLDDLDLFFKCSTYWIIFRFGDEFSLHFVFLLKSNTFNNYTV